MTCDVCGRDAASNLCGRCAGYVEQSGAVGAKPTKHHTLAGQLAADLAALPPLYALLGNLRLPGARPPDPNASGKRAKGGKGSHPSKPPLDLTVLELEDQLEKPKAPPVRERPDIDRMSHRWRDGDGKMRTSPGSREQGILPTLSSWVRLVDGEMWDEGDEHQNPPTQRTVEGECGWLAENLDWITAQRWLDEISGDVHRMVMDLRRVTGEHEERDPLCSRCGWPARPQDERKSWYACSGGCGMTWVMANEIDRLNKAQSGRLTAEECAAELRITARTIRAYKSEGRISAVGKRGTADLFSVEHVRRAHEKAQKARDPQSGRYLPAS